MQELIRVAAGYEPADLVLAGVKLVNVFSGEIIKTNVAIKGGLIAGIGDYTNAVQVVDLEGKYLLPGLIDGHIHIESSLLTPPNFAAVAVLHGTTTVIADPHEIVNVAGDHGLAFMIECAHGLPVSIFYTVPSCVPATTMETCASDFGAPQIAQAFEKYCSIVGLGEMMNYPGVYHTVPDILEKISIAHKNSRVVDGHAPMVTGKELVAYVSAGISSDHETMTAEEALEKIRLGVQVLIREGSAARNLNNVLPAVTEKNAGQFSFCCDDRHPADLIEAGEIDNILRQAVAKGLDPITAVRMATINTARHYRLYDIGAIAPGYRADMVIVDDLKLFKIDRVYKDGRLVVSNNKVMVDIPRHNSTPLCPSVHIPDLKGKLTLKPAPAGADANVIEVLPDQITTGRIIVSAEEVESGKLDLAKVAVVERFGKNGNFTVGLVKGFGLKRGALASTIAHDSHNLIIVGQNDSDMEVAARAVAAIQGGMVVVEGGEVIASLPLSVGGLMSDGTADMVAGQYAQLQQAAMAIGCVLPSPFMTMSFLALPVIPDLKITDKGLVDVTKFNFIDLWTTR